MAGLDPGIHVLASLEQEGVDGQDKPGHDEHCYLTPSRAPLRKSGPEIVMPRQLMVETRMNLPPAVGQ